MIMRKNNVAYQANGKDVPAYFDFDKMMESYVEILKDARDGIWENEHEQCLVMDEFSDDFIDEYAFECCCENNSDMKKYLHQKDHKILGNFNNIEWDYENRIYKETGKFGDFSDLVKRLDEMDCSQQTNDDREWIVDWFFETFGTFGIQYNFKDTICEYLYECENDDAA